jgi:hypothetical protein
MLGYEGYLEHLRLPEPNIYQGLPSAGISLIRPFIEKIALARQDKPTAVAHFAQIATQAVRVILAEYPDSPPNNPGSQLIA